MGRVWQVVLPAGYLRLGVFSFLVHDFQDHAAGGGAALRGGVDADGLLSSTGILLTVNVNPAGTGQFTVHIMNGSLVPHLHTSAVV